MSVRARTIAAVLAFTLAAMLPATCPCPPQSSASATGYECCAPSTALRAVDRGCCGGAATVTDALAVPPAPDVVASVPSSSVMAVPQRVASASAARPSTTAPSPPPLILRI
jgi:hypothetical protein